MDRFNSYLSVRAWTFQPPCASAPSGQPSVITYDRMATVTKRLAGTPVRDAVHAGVAADPLDPAVIGARVKALREASSLSLRDLAARSGVSAPMLSQVERGETSPTLTVAARIAAGLELRLSQLLRLDEGGSVTVVRADERQRGGSKRRGHAFEVLTSPQPGQRAELSRHTLSPGGATGAADDPPMHEPGSRETALVERGAVVLVCDGQRHELSEGDCVTFDADLPHHFENTTSAEAAFLAVVAAGLRRS
jgi:transcriptional regulator with XRE-family HTH domain